jgi:RNA methyltransferase, TrmH family
MNNINSLQNKKIKYLTSLRNNQKRKKNEYFLIDGLREISEAYNNDYYIEELFFCQELIKKELNFNIKKTKLSKTVFLKIAYPQNPDGWLALAKPKEHTLENINPNLIIILEAIEKPGNLGAIIRTARATNVDLIILNDQSLDLYNPNTIKSSTGSVFSVPVISLSQEETIKYLKRKKIKSLATSLGAKRNIFKYNLKEKIAFIFGSEANGLSKAWLQKADDLVKIPMENEIDSLNVSVSVAVSIYETKRQRQELTI